MKIQYLRVVQGHIVELDADIPELETRILSLDGMDWMG